MFAYIKGKFHLNTPSEVVIDAQGIGYRLFISLQTYGEIKNKSEGMLHTHLHIKEDAHTLYGFYTKHELDVFLHLISISGVGPNTALLVLSSFSSKELEYVIIEQNVDKLKTVKGIGKKTAERIILELKDKLGKNSDTEHLKIIQGSHNTMHEEALSALVTLGFQKSVAQKSIALYLRKNTEDQSVEEIIKFVLKQSR